MLAVSEAAEELRVSTDLIYRLVRDGEIEHRRLGRRVLIPRVVVDGLCGIDRSGGQGQNQPPSP